MLCPICQNPVEEPKPGEKSPFPFCSERCKLIDLGRWLGGKYQIPVIDTDESHHGERESESDGESEK
jgi:uncharacterized protein